MPEHHIGEAEQENEWGAAVRLLCARMVCAACTAKPAAAAPAVVVCERKRGVVPPPPHTHTLLVGGEGAHQASGLSLTRAL